jgi:hypothetical protein
MFLKKMQREEEKEEVDHKVLNQIYPEVHYVDPKSGSVEGDNA